jgi:hypothetical protein
MRRINIPEAGYLLVLFSTNILATLFAMQAVRTRDPSATVMAAIQSLDAISVIDATVYLAVMIKQQEQVIHPAAIVYLMVSGIISLLMAFFSDMIAGILLIHIISLPAICAFLALIFMSFPKTQ